MCHMQTLFLNDNKIGDQGMVKFSEALEKGAMDKVTYINLDHNQATETGKKAMRDVAKARGFRVDLA